MISKAKKKSEAAGHGTDRFVAVPAARIEAKVALLDLNVPSAVAFRHWKRRENHSYRNGAELPFLWGQERYLKHPRLARRSKKAAARGRGVETELTVKVLVS
jgi:hypothetical protein